MAHDAFTPEQLEKLVSFASQQLGTTPEQLKSAFAKNGLAGISSSLSQEDIGKAEALLKDKQKASELMNNPHVQKLLSQLLGQ